MNSNTHNRASNNSYTIIPPIYIYIILPYLPNPIYNPTISDFENLIRQYDQYFFYNLGRFQNYPRSPTRNLTINKITTPINIIFMLNSY